MKEENMINIYGKQKTENVISDDKIKYTKLWRKKYDYKKIYHQLQQLTYGLKTLILKTERRYSTAKVSIVLRHIHRQDERHFAILCIS